MRSYFQFCPLAQATQLPCERWTLRGPALTHRLRQWLGASGLAALGERGETSTLLSEGIVS